MNKYKDIKSIRPIFYLSNVLATAPTYSFKSQECSFAKLHCIYSMFILILVLIMCLWSIQGRYSWNYKAMKATMITLDMLSFITLLILNCLSILKLVLWPDNKFRKFLNLLRLFDAKSHIPVIDHIPGCFIIEMCFYQMYLIGFYVCDSMFWLTHFHISYFKYYLFRYVQYYQCVTLGFLITQYAKLITDRFKYINDMLKTSKKISGDNISYLTDKKHLIDYNNIKRAHILYNDLCIIVDLFNTVFGGMLLLITLSFVIGLLEPLNLMMYYALNVGQFDILTGGTHMYLLTALWAGMFLVRSIYN